MQNILAVVAHPDDFEMMAGASACKWVREKKNVHVLVLTNGSWKSPDGQVFRSSSDIAQEIARVKDFMDYASYEILGEDTLGLNYEDRLVCEVLQRIALYKIDTIVTSWDKDSHRDHRIAYEIALAAARRVPNFLVGPINYYLTESFSPNLYVDVSDCFSAKLECLELYESQWGRSGKDWGEYLQAQALCYGRVMGVTRAEAFIAKKMLL